MGHSMCRLSAHQWDETPSKDLAGIFVSPRTFVLRGVYQKVRNIVDCMPLHTVSFVLVTLFEPIQDRELGMDFTLPPSLPSDNLTQVRYRQGSNCPRSGPWKRRHPLFPHPGCPFLSIRPPTTDGD